MPTPRRLLGEPMVLDRHQASWKVIVPLFILSGLSCTLLFSRVGVLCLDQLTETQLPVTQQATFALQGCPSAVVAGLAAAMLAAPANAAIVKLGSDSGGLVFAPEGVNASALSAEDLVNAPGEKHTAKFEKAGEYS